MDLSKNKLDSIPEEMLGIASLRYVDVSDNPLVQREDIHSLLAEWKTKGGDVEVFIGTEAAT